MSLVVGIQGGEGDGKGGLVGKEVSLQSTKTRFFGQPAEILGKSQYSLVSGWTGGRMGYLDIPERASMASDEG